MPQNGQRLQQGAEQCQLIITANKQIKEAAKRKNWKMALQILSGMVERSIEPDVITYSTAINACGRGKQPERAGELLVDMQKRGLERHFGSSIGA